MIAKHRKPKTITMSVLDVTLMLLLGTVGVIMVLASHLLGRIHAPVR